MNIYNKKHKQGFSLVEMMVSLMIFSVVAVIALGAMIKIVSVNKKAQMLLSSITNINFALDIMSRELSLANGVYCSSRAPDTDSPIVSFSTASASVSCNNSFNAGNSVVLAFKTTNFGPGCSTGQTLASAYLFHIYPSNNTHFTLEKSQQTDCGQDFGSTGAPFVSVTSSDVTLQDFYVNVSYDNSTQKYPLVSLHLSGYAGIASLEKTYFSVQTSISLPKLQ